jgi:tRNA(Glu) U13 pseudouridine synthase TruD
MPYQIKQIPEDFLVWEKSSKILFDKGDYLVFIMRKKNYPTEKAVQAIANALNINRKSLGYAGAKDSSAITEQYITIYQMSKEKIMALKLKDIALEFAGYNSEPISLGDLYCNEFEIIVRNINEKPNEISRIVNYYGEQRFSTNNAEIGKSIIKKQFKKATELILEHAGFEEDKLRKYLRDKGQDYVGALKKMPWKTLNMYIHAYQSKIWNETAGTFLMDEKSAVDSVQNLNIPIVGFGTELENYEGDGVRKNNGKRKY